MSGAQAPEQAIRRRPDRAAGRRRERADLRAYARDRDAAARERLVCTYLPLARSIARRFHRGDRVSLDDLQQVAAIGLMKALDRFDVNAGTAFSSFAVPTISGELRRYFRDQTWTVRPPRGLQERTLRIERERELLTGGMGRNPTAAELAARAQCSVEEVIDAAQAAQARTGDSLQRPVGMGDEGETTLGELLGADEPGFARAEARATLDQLLTFLPQRERDVLSLRFRDDLTQAEIGQRIGCSQMQVSRLLRRALARLGDVADGGTAGVPAADDALELD